MYCLRLCHLILAASLLCLVQASWPHFNLLGLRYIAPRQLSGSGNLNGTSSPTSTTIVIENSTPSSVPSPTPTSSPSPTIPSETPATTPSSETTTSANSDKPGSEPPKPSSTPDLSPLPATTPTLTTPSNSQSDKQSYTLNSFTTSNNPKDQSTSPTRTVLVSTQISVITMTNSDGSTVLATSTTRTTSTPDLNVDGSNPTSGMSPKTRNTIIGVVVGVGGAIALGALGLVAWRSWGRKKNSEENDGLMDYNMTVTSAEKNEPGGSVGPAQRSPFQSTLENYHQPTHVNASSNF